MTYFAAPRCANCLCTIHPGDTTGVSGLYNPIADSRFLLCEDCWLDEEDLIDSTGTNDHPERVSKYRRNLS